MDAFYSDVIKSQVLLNFYRKKVHDDLEIHFFQVSSSVKAQPLWENDVSALIHKSAKTSWPLDSPPTSLVVVCLDVLLPVISGIVNLSLSCDHFSEEWKEALKLSDP